MERFPLGSAVDVLDGSLASAWSALDGNTAGSPYLPPSIPGNALDHPTWDASEAAPPFYEVFNGITYFDNSWGHYGQLYPYETFATITRNFWKANFPAFKDLGGVNLDDQPKVIKMYGMGNNFPGNTGDYANDDNTRGSINTNIPLTAFSETAPAGTYPDSGSWTKIEWMQGVDIPDSATKVKFGAYIRVEEDDDFRANNCGGVYIWQDVSATSDPEVYVNSIICKRDADTINLVTGTQSTGFNSTQQWSGMTEVQETIPDYDYPSTRKNNITHVQSIDYVNSSNYRQFRRIEKEVTLQTGTSRKLGFGMFFAENQANLDGAAVNTGSIDFYNSFVVFE